jgi:WD40 repeat protein
MRSLTQSLPRELLASDLHASAATGLDFSPDMQEVVTVGEDGTIHNLQLTAAKPHVSFRTCLRDRLNHGLELKSLSWALEVFARETND